MKSLKSKIFLYFILFAIIPLIISSSVILKQMYESKKKSIYLKQNQILKQVIDESDAIIENIEHIGGFIKSKYKTHGNDFLDNIPFMQSYISNVFIINNDAKIINYNKNSKSNVLNGYDVSYQEYFIGLKNKNTYWSNISLSPVTLRPSISYSIRIDNEKIAILIIDLNILNQFAKKFKSENESYMVRIIDKEGIYIAYPQYDSFVSQRKDILNTLMFKDIIKKKIIYKQQVFLSHDNDKKIGVFGISEKLKWHVVVQESYDYIFKDFIYILWSLMSFVILLILISIYYSFKLSKTILKPLDKINNNINKISKGEKLDDFEATKYKELNHIIDNFLLMENEIINRESKVRIEIDKNKTKDKQMFEQSKMAAMGEMIGNIAHQWRQPLSIISTSATSMQVQKEMNILEDERFTEFCENINSQAQYLSTTIDDFKNYIKGDRVLENFDINSEVKSFVRLIESSSKSNNIKIILDLEENIFCDGYRNELKQCFINIYNNSKDALNANDIDNKLFLIKSKLENDKVVISFQDNAGGIDKNIIEKIFEPYFTTKHQSRGTGLGLHMTYNLIVNGMKGSIYAVNNNFIYDGRKEKGAKFTIKI